MAVLNFISNEIKSGNKIVQSAVLFSSKIN